MSDRGRRNKIATSMLFGVLCLLCLPLSAEPPAVMAEPVSQVGLLIPLYSVPGPSWQALIQEKESYPSLSITAIVNPQDGPGLSPSANYSDWITRLRTAGVDVLGYVYTSYGNRSAASVESDISDYFSWYAVTGVFLDEMASAPGYEQYYSTLTSYSHQLGLGTVVGNPGTAVPSSYVGTVDVTVLSEKPGVPSASQLAWDTGGQNRTDVALIAYGVPSISRTMVTLMENYAAEIYLTDYSGSNPYSALPSYFEELANLTASLEPTQTVTVDAIAPSGVKMTGLSLIVSTQAGDVVAQGVTPFEFIGTGGAQYTVTLGTPNGDVFDGWTGGQTNSTYVFVLIRSETLTAEFSPNVQASVTSALASGSLVHDMWVDFCIGNHC